MPVGAGLAGDGDAGPGLPVGAAPGAGDGAVPAAGDAVPLPAAHCAGVAVGVGVAPGAASATPRGTPLLETPAMRTGSWYLHPTRKATPAKRPSPVHEKVTASPVLGSAFHHLPDTSRFLRARGRADARVMPRTCASASSQLVDPRAHCSASATHRLASNTTVLTQAVSGVVTGRPQASQVVVHCGMARTAAEDARTSERTLDASKERGAVPKRARVTASAGTHDRLEGGGGAHWYAAHSARHWSTRLGVGLGVGNGVGVGVARGVWGAAVPPGVAVGAAACDMTNKAFACADGMRDAHQQQRWRSSVGGRTSRRRRGGDVAPGAGLAVPPGISGVCDSRISASHSATWLALHHTASHRRSC